MFVEQISSGPLCPRSGGLRHPRHIELVEGQNEIYAAFARHPDDHPEHPGEPIDEEGEAAAQKALLDRMNIYASDRYSVEYMRLYRANTSIRPGGLRSSGYEFGYIQAWYFQCQVCGFVLPANYVKRPQ